RPAGGRLVDRRDAHGWPIQVPRYRDAGDRRPSPGARPAPPHGRARSGGAPHAFRSGRPGTQDPQGNRRAPGADPRARPADRERGAAEARSQLAGVLVISRFLLSVPLLRYQTADRAGVRRFQPRVLFPGSLLPALVFPPIPDRSPPATTARQRALALPLRIP